MKTAHIYRRFRSGASADAIAALYSGAFADVGFYLPLDDRTYMWQEHTGQTPVTADNDTVGLVLDKSQGVRVTEDGGGNRTLTGLGDEQVINGDLSTTDKTSFIDGGDMTWGTPSGGEITLTRGAGANGSYIETAGTFTNSDWMRVQFEFRKTAGSGSERLFLFDEAIGSTIIKTTSPTSFILRPGDNLAIWTDTNTTIALSNISIKPVPGNHAYQNTAASRPIWNATEEGVDFDGTDDALKVDGVSSLTSTSTLGVPIKTSDTTFELAGGSSAFLQVSSATTTALGYGGSLYIDGVKIYNASEADAQALSDGSDHFVEIRGCDPSADTDFTIGDVTDNLDGVLGRGYLTSNTGTTALDAARAQVASAEGITLRNTETLTDQVATGGVYGPSNDTANMFQDSAGTTPVTADQDPVGLVSNPVSGGADLTQTTAAARPLYDETSGLYDFDGTDDHFLADLTGIGDRTNMYFACVVDTTNLQFVLCSSATDGAFFLAASGASVPASSVAGTPTYYVDGALVADDRLAVRSAISSQGAVLVEAVGLDLSATRWDATWFCDYGSGPAASNVFGGFAGEFVLIPNPGVVGRNIIRRDILARHPSITFAGA